MRFVCLQTSNLKVVQSYDTFTACLKFISSTSLLDYTNTLYSASCVFPQTKLYYDLIGGDWRKQVGLLCSHAVHMTNLAVCFPSIFPPSRLELHILDMLQQHCCLLPMDYPSIPKFGWCKLDLDFIPDIRCTARANLFILVSIRVCSKCTLLLINVFANTLLQPHD
jgi:hypothetical protein